MGISKESENVILNTNVKSIETERIPQSREVASGMKNLGNTCYMNAVLQALAHAPELCHAIDSLPHHSICPIAIENEKDEKLRQLQKQSQKENKDSTESGSASTSPLPDCSTNSTNTSKKKSRKKKVNLLEEAGILTGEFCALCEFEKHIVRAHKSGTNQYSQENMDASSSSNSLVNDSKNVNTITSSPAGGNNQQTVVVPADFVKGFIRDVAPGFKLGVQEDSHEFLRLLIDAMQTCCKIAAQKINMMTSENLSKEQIEKQIQEEYPFQLFQGTVQSSVKCNACKETSVTLDPFEDIGLEVTNISRNSSCNASMSSSSDKTSRQLADVPTSLERFTREEQLDAQYKCDKCGVLGSATKQTRLARIPPILTLHLKRFRYGQQSSSSLESRGIGSGVNGSSNYGGAYGTSSSLGFGSSHNNNGNVDFPSSGFGGTSGSAKIEGHIRFDQFFDIRPFLTTEMKKNHRAMFCRLFAVIVHTGKNSHSGHYISYVRNLAKNEWWMMDDSRIMRVSTEEVVHSEAYMLFYRVVDHPVAARLKTKSSEQIQHWQNIEDERKKKEMDQVILMKQNDAANVIDENKNNPISNTSDKPKDNKGQNSPSTGSNNKDVSHTNETSPNCKENDVSCSNNNSDEHNGSRNKRPLPKYVDGYEWADKRMKMLDVLTPIIHRIDDKIGDRVNFKFEYFQFITKEASESGKIGCGPSGVSVDDVQDGCEIYRKTIRKIFHRIFRDGNLSLTNRMTKEENKIESNTSPYKESNSDSEIDPNSSKEKSDEIGLSDSMDLQFKDLIPVVDSGEGLL